MSTAAANLGLIGGSTKSANIQLNRNIISGLEQQQPIELKDRNQYSTKQYSGTVFDSGKWKALVIIDGIKYFFGHYESEEGAAVAYATATYHLVHLPRRLQIQEAASRAEDLAQAFALNGPTSVPLEDESRDKYDNKPFYDEGRHHHNPDVVPDLFDQQFFTKERCQEIHEEINKKIEQCADLQYKIYTEMFANRLKSIPCRAILSGIDAPIHSMFETNAQSLEELKKMVISIMNEYGESKDLEFFYEPEKMVKYEKDLNQQGKNALALMQITVRRRMILYLCHKCYYCGASILPNHPGKWYGWDTDHLSILSDKVRNTSLRSGSALSHGLEFLKCVPSCASCNPKGDEARTFPIDRFYHKMIVIDDDELSKHQTVFDILDSERFKNFCDTARFKMNLDYSDYVDDNGVPSRRSEIHRCATFLELKLLVWECFPGILLEDIVVWRKISDHATPRYAFRTTVIKLVKVLSNCCPGTKEGGKCTGKYNLRNLNAWQYCGIHLDHNGGAGTHSKKGGRHVSDYISHSWDEFIGEIRKCCVLCAECHMGV